MRKQLLDFYKAHPLRSILFVGLFLRVISAIFAVGYLFSDDHYFVIEEAQFWIDGDFGKLPWWKPFVIEKDRIPHGMFYSGLHFILFQFLSLFGIENPESKMYIVRFLHAFYSLSTIWLGYKISLKFTNQKQSLQVAWMLSLFCIFPLVSVKNLIEFVSVPPLLASIYFYLYYPKNSFKNGFIIGVLAGIAFAIRYQTLLISSGVFLYFIISKDWKSTFYSFIGFLFCGIILQGLLDKLVWNKPFHEILGYVNYNLHHSSEYPNSPWYSFPLLLLGIFIIPLGFFYYRGFFYSLKRLLILNLPILIFLIFHSSFPNKQERFILTILPFFIVSGTIGWNDFLSHKNNEKLNSFSDKGMRFFWIVNSILLLILTPASTKTGKINVMNYLRNQNHVKHFAMESTHKSNIEYMPRYYLGSWYHPEQIVPICAAECFFDTVKIKKKSLPEYIVFCDSNDINNRVKSIKNQVQTLTFETEIKPSWLDQIVAKLNPKLSIQSFYIYKPIYPKNFVNSKTSGKVWNVPKD